MKKLKVLVVVCVIVMLVAFLAGCQTKKVLIVGTEATFAPFEFVDEKNNIVGFDIDVINYIAKELGEKIEIKNQPFETLVESLAAKQIDIVIAGMTITDERAQKVLFSKPYYNAHQVIVVLESDTTINAVEDLADKVIAVQVGTTGAMEAAGIKGADEHPQLKQFKRVNEAFMELQNGRADAVIIDAPVAKNYMAKLGGMKYATAPFTEEEKFGIAVHKENKDLMDKINKALDKLVQSGEYDNFVKKWFE
ncbi:MAG: amino acid ABC transporter substrate-binding protein [Bacillota bacterium]|nr:MAG: amino acid ABC transporter substrate-binding protein [Bacillota bacterium]